MSQFDLTDEQRQIQEMAQQFTADAITPHAAEWDEKHIFPRDTIRQAAELGFGSIYVSPDSGGIGLGRLEAALIMEAMAYGCPSTSAFISIHNMASWMIDRFGSAAVKEKYLPSMVTMERIGSYCLTEPGSGSDAAALKTKAVRDGDSYVVSGSKAFISGGGENEIYVTMTRTGVDGPKGISCLVIEKDMPGVSFGAQEKKLGWHSQPTAQVNFDEVRVPAENLVGGEGEGFRIAMMGLDGGRLNIGACSLGGAQRCLDEAVKYTKERKQFGQPIADFQNTQFMLADMETELQASRMLLYAAGGEGDRERARQDQVRRHGQAPRHRQRLVDRRPRAPAPWRLRLSPGLSDRALLARPARPFDPRRHQPGDADDRRAGADPAVSEMKADQRIPPPQRGGGRGRGFGLFGRVSNARHPLPTLPLKGEGL
jgi:alkylation response protein AidB-like acyl-CoA dehydrogenase